ncbi:MAG: site-specific integrase [Gammaproteobacteria bacterium]
MSTKQSTSKLKVISKNPIFQEDVWSFEALGYKEDERPSGQNNLTLYGISQPWLRDRFKEIIWRKRVSVQAYTIVAYARVGRSLSAFIDTEYDRSSIQIVTKDLMQRYMESISDKSHATRSSTCSQLNEITTCWMQWGLLSKDKYPLITKDMAPRRRPASKPKGLSFKVQNDMDSYLNSEDTEATRMFKVMMEIGMRGSELLALKKDCLTQDNEGDWYLTRLNRKYLKEHTVPVSHEVANLVKLQITCNEEYCENMDVLNPNNFLFGHKRKGKFKPYSLRAINTRLKRITENIKLTNELGVKQKISTHAFRHTVGTNLINNGVDMITVQNFLGHETPMMTAIYAQLHNKTMRTAINKAQNQLVDIKGKLYTGLDVIQEVEVIKDDDTPIEAKWLKLQLATQALSNGICALPIKQTCPHANACLTCTSFRTDKTFIDVHRQQLKTAKNLVNESKAKNYTRQYDLNVQVRDNLITIIDGLEAVNDQ